MTKPPHTQADRTPPGEDLGSTAALLQRIRAGDAAARERLVERFLPRLRRWARARMPVPARDLADTDDLVQITLLRALDRVKEFEERGKGSFLAYLRRILLNEVRAELRQARRRPGRQELPPDLAGAMPSPLESAIGRERLARFERALESLPPEQQEAVLLRMELGFSHDEVAEAIGAPSANAARMMVARALVRLSERMNEAG